MFILHVEQLFLTKITTGGDLGTHVYNESTLSVAGDLRYDWVGRGRVRITVVGLSMNMDHWDHTTYEIEFV